MRGLESAALGRYAVNKSVVRFAAGAERNAASSAGDDSAASAEGQRQLRGGLQRAHLPASGQVGGGVGGGAWRESCG